MADPSTSLILDALTKAMADPSGARLHGNKKMPGLFATLGFTLVPRDSLPQKVFVDCSLCRRRDACDELALVKELS